ncbi:MAG: hypothetical protein E6G60_13820 [Actinobacteria bacterium]|nr:MAG: hypothetical protein E6G60_13820 [Actinomycetota bacterium]
MGILDEDVAKVRELTDIVALVSEHVALKRAGRQYAGLCPFHQEKSASFSVNPEMGVYYCFGCQASGDAITFIREIEHLDFVEAVERLAARANITLRYDDRATQRDRSRKDRLSECVAAAIDFYHQRLLTADDAGRARGYLRSRRRRRRSALPPRMGTRRLGRAVAALAKAELRACRHRRRRARVRESGQQAARPVPQPAHVPDPRSTRRRGRIWWPRPRRSRAEVQELARDPAVSKEPSAVWPSVGEGRDRCSQRSRHLRGLHRRDGVRARGRAQRGGHVRHRPRR